MRKQIKFTFQIGYAEQSEAFETDVIRGASTCCGGCTTRHAVGWWRDDGDERKVAFMGKLEREHCFEVELTCELHKAEAVYDAMRDMIAGAVAEHGIATNWVHVTETEMRGRHFSVEAIKGASVAA